MTSFSTGRPSAEQLGRAFSSHRFQEVFPHLAADVRWVQVGEATVLGREAVIAACTQAAAELAQASTHFRRFLVVAADGVAAVDAIGEYTDPSGQRSAVSSCDIYEVTDGALTTITSYAVEVSADTAG